MYNFDPVFYKNFYFEIKNNIIIDETSDQETLEFINHTHDKNEEHRITCEEQFHDLYPDFKVDFYNEFNPDLKHCNMTQHQLMYHYHIKGKNEEHRFTCEEQFYNLYPDFKVDFYNEFNPDLKQCNMNQYQLMYHYHIKGKNEEHRFTFEEQFHDLYPDFKVDFYNEFNPDLKDCNMTQYQLMYHYHIKGKNEEHRFTFEEQFYNLYPDFKVDIYNDFNLDLKACNMNQYQLMYHYHIKGKNEENRFTCEEQFYNLYPDFKVDIYNNFNPDLKECNMTQYQLMYHYHNNYKNEEHRFTSEKQFHDLYPEFDVEIYKNFNPDLSQFNNFQLIYHYHTIGFFTNKIYFAYDYYANSKENDITPELQDKIQNHSYFRKIKNYEELIEFHKTYKKKYFIYCKESFYKYYPDFDFDFYKNKYFLNTGSDSESEEKSEIEILLYYHLQGVSLNHIINNKIKFLIYTPPYHNKYGGIIVMHYLAQLINQSDPNKYYAKLFMHNDLKYDNQFCTDFAKIDEINDNTVVMYPETVSGNPLNAKNVVRWILLELETKMPFDDSKNFGENDHIYYWGSKDLSVDKQLTCPWLNPVFYNKKVENVNRQKTCYINKKGRLIHKKISNQYTNIHPPDSICIDDLSSEEINEIFNESKYFYCYDPNSAYVIFSLVCGCIPIIQPIEGVNEIDYFKSRIFNFKGTIYNKGIVYGYHENIIKYILKNKLNENNDKYYKNLCNMYNETVTNFLTDFEKIIL